MDKHKRRPLAPELTAILGMQTHPYSPTDYLLGKRHKGAVVPIRDDRVYLQIPGLDHPTCWTKQGRRVVISEPYGISYQTLRQMVNFAEMYGLEFSIDARFQSWNPGRCDAVIWTKQGAPLSH